MDYTDLALRWIHILSAVTAAGGVIFWRFVLVPATANMDNEAREQFISPIRKPWAMLVMITTLLLLVTGLVNAVRSIKAYSFGDMTGTYHTMVMVKLALAMAFFYLAARLSGRSDSAVRFRQKLGFWYNLLFLTALGLVLAGGFMKTLPHVPKASAASESVPAVEPATPAAEPVSADS